MNATTTTPPAASACESDRLWERQAQSRELEARYETDCGGSRYVLDVFLYCANPQTKTSSKFFRLSWKCPCVDNLKVAYGHNYYFIVVSVQENH